MGQGHVARQGQQGSAVAGAKLPEGRWEVGGVTAMCVCVQTVLGVD